MLSPIDMRFLADIEHGSAVPGENLSAAFNSDKVIAEIAREFDTPNAKWLRLPAVTTWCEQQQREDGEER